MNKAWKIAMWIAGSIAIGFSVYITKSAWSLWAFLFLVFASEM